MISLKQRQSWSFAHYLNKMVEVQDEEIIAIESLGKGGRNTLEKCRWVIKD